MRYIFEFNLNCAILIKNWLLIDRTLILTEIGVLGEPILEEKEIGPFVAIEREDLIANNRI